MNNYKIKVNNESESKEAQDLFKQIGCGDVSVENNHESIQMWADGTLTSHSQHDDVYTYFKELTLPQLRDMVVLHRNDVKDANYKLFISPSQGYLSFYKASDDVFYAYAEKSKCWDKSRSVDIKNKDLEPIQSSKEDDQRLISGADALRALADGKEVERKLGIGWCNDVKKLPAETILHGVSELRIKPRTIKLELEIPACGTNYKLGQLIWVLNSLEPKEYCSVILDESDELPAYWWSTEEEIKQVVEALRGGIKG